VSSRPRPSGAGTEPLDAGGIDQAHYFEAMAAVIIRLVVCGADPLSPAVTFGVP
jgi:predicted dinucleotide-binding enzyme